MGGFTYLGVLFALAMIGLALAAAGTTWSMQQQRAREQQLLWVGQQFRVALMRYYASRPLGVGQFPRELGDLLEDQRGPVILRHLRRIYRDPMTGNDDWDLIKAVDGTIIGVASKATGTPIKQAGFEPQLAEFAHADCYCSWRFIYLPPGLPGDRRAGGEQP